MARLGLLALVLVTCVAVASAQAPVNAERAVRYHSQNLGPDLAESVTSAQGGPATVLVRAPEKQLLSAVAQLNELGSIYVFSRDDAAQLNELGSIYVFSRDDAAQLNELGSIYVFSRDDAAQLNELGSIYTFSRD